jgi:hypothetical protein
LVQDEGEYWDYKEQLEINDPRHKAELARDVLGFANGKGGALIFGVSKDYKVTGVSDSALPDTASIKERIQKYTGPDIHLFQTTIDISKPGRCLWVLFVCRRTGAPLPVRANGPEVRPGKLIIAKGEHYQRVGDQTKLCEDPNDLDRLYAGYSFQHLQAYTYDVDEAYYRLLAPHCEQFFGRSKIITEVASALESRHFIIALDGVGGVGKSAVAIELVRKLYDAEKYFPIISLSAKNKVWTTSTSSRQAGFSGFSELLSEAAKVLRLDLPNDIDILKRKVIESLEGHPALLLIDNMEEIDDPAVLHFLSREVPEPVKVLVTSRIDRGLGGLAISVPEMQSEEARELLFFEFDHFGYNNYLSETTEIEELIEVTGRLPLALKWAASLAEQRGNLREVIRALRGKNTAKSEFLNFCFATMFDSLSPLAREVALLCPYLSSEWNTSTISIALDASMQEVSKAILELKDRGIVMASRTAEDEAHRLLPLTVDFLGNRWHQNQTLRERVKTNLSDAFASNDAEGLLFHWPKNKMIEFLEASARGKLAERGFEKADCLVQLALHHERDIPRLQFLRGRIEYEKGNKASGLAIMQNVRRSHSHKSDGESLGLDQLAFLAEVQLEHGPREEWREALSLVRHCLESSNFVSPTLLQLSTECALELREYTTLSRLLKDLKTADMMFYVALPVMKSLEDPNVVHHLGEVVVSVLRGAASSPKAEGEVGDQFLKIANKAEEILSKRAKQLHSE